MKILPIAVCLSACLLALPIQASVLSSGFESGDFTGWSSLGDVAVTDSSFGTGPVAGIYQALLTTANSSISADGFNYSGNDAVLSTSLESFLQLSSGVLGAVEGSGLSQSFTANAGTPLSFAWNFLTDAPTQSYNDFAFVVLDGTLFPLANTLSPLQGSSSSFSYETGFANFYLTLNSSGAHTLSFGIVDVGDNLAVSGLLIDNITLPEPGGLTLLGLGLVAWVTNLMIVRRKSDRHI